MESIERAVLASFIMADTYVDSEHKKILCAELYEEWFEHQGHKIIVKIINHMKMLEKPIYFELVRKEAFNMGYNIDDLLLDISTCNVFNYNTFKAYYDDMKTSNKKSLVDLI